MNPNNERFDYAGLGNVIRIEDLESQVGPALASAKSEKIKKLSAWPATAICGNDISSSCLYVSALSIMVAGAYAPVALLVVGFVLYLYRKIYAEVGSALPLNGGTYTVLLNTTNKRLAAVAACLTLLSYIATAVISGGEAMHYANHMWPQLPVMFATVVLLGFFAVLNVVGLSESSIVALVIFVFHLFSLTVLVLFSSWMVFQNPLMLISNISLPPPSGAGMFKALYLGFAAAMLGISGFESSANFIEEQKPGVFPKTLKYMWLIVTVFNPLIALLALGLMSMGEVSENSTRLLSALGERSGGVWLRNVIAVDAILVLSGAVLTSYVGVVGLIRRMSVDRCLPQFLLKKNEWRKTNHWIIIFFFILCCLILFLTKGKVEILAGVYALSFLCVMALYAVGNMLLKVRRSKLPRAESAGWVSLVVALIAVLIGLAGNLSVENLQIFLLFLVLMVGVVGLILYRVSLMWGVLYGSHYVMEKIRAINQKVSSSVFEKIVDIQSQKVVYFTKGDDMATLNSAALYVLDNEPTNNLLIVNVYEKNEDIPLMLTDHLKTIDKIYPHLRIDCMLIKGVFGPELIDQLSRKLKTPKNYMFIGTPGHYFPHRLEDLGGVRLILG